MKLLTHDRIKALGKINRFNGWTSRPYSVLEHCVIGATSLHRRGAHQDLIRAFLIHDMHETSFGDIIRPVKRRYLMPEFDVATQNWDRRLCDEVGLSTAWVGHGDVVLMDNLMLSHELHHPTLVTRTEDREFPDNRTEATGHIDEMIDSEVFRGDLSIEAWWALWD